MDLPALTLDLCLSGLDATHVDDEDGERIDVLVRVDAWDEPLIIQISEVDLSDGRGVGDELDLVQLYVGIPRTIDDDETRERITEAEAFERISGPFREFMVKNVREKDLNLFSDIAQENDPTFTPSEDVALRVIVPAFMISEIRRGFEIGFLILVPFLVIDLIVATITMAMGMMMLPPTVVALPFKVLFFILIDGWNLLVGSMMRSFL